jgi:hypothetical protein
VHDADFGLPAVLGSVAAIALGPVAYALARRFVTPAKSDATERA